MDLSCYTSHVVRKRTRNEKLVLVVLFDVDKFYDFKCFGDDDGKMYPICNVLVVVGLNNGLTTLSISFHFLMMQQGAMCREL